MNKSLMTLVPLMLASLLLPGTSAQPPLRMRETDWAKQIAQGMGLGLESVEYVLPDQKRVDILGPDVAWEVEWCDKWAESIGQSIYYAHHTHRKPGVILLMRGEHAEERYLEFMIDVAVLRGAGIDMHVKVVETE